ncbi:DUF2635 domain-containing protein [Methylobacillus pratensis]
MHVIPVSGRQVPDPVKGDYLPKEGRQVQKDTYWLRRVADGDVTVKAEGEETTSKTKGATK